MAEVELWLHPDVFYYGSVYAHPKLTIPYLKKVVAYAKSKGKDGGFPNLSWLIWKHMAVNKMLMMEDLAWTYFQMFHTLRETTAKERLEHAELQHQLSESGDSTLYRKFIQVPTLEFVLFLYMQQANKVSLRRSLIGDEWPGSSPRAVLDSQSHQSKSEATANMLDERKHTQFVLSHFNQIIDLLSEGYKGQDSTQHDLTVTADVVKALGFIVWGRVLKQNSVLSVYEIAIRHRIQGKSGYIRSTSCFSVRTFENWLRAALTENPYGLATCITSGTKLKWTSIAADQENSRKKARIATNAPSAPVGHKVMFFTQCSNQTIARQTSILAGSYVKLHRCHKSYFYLLSPLKCVSIEKCTGSTFVLGPVATCIRLANCQNVTLIAPCQSIMITGSSGMTLHVTTPTQPIVSCDNVTTEAEPPVTFAPYNTFYPELENHLASVGLTVSAQTDQWENPICVGNMSNLSLSSSRLSDVVRPRSPMYSGSGDASSLHEEEKFFKIMKPSDFYVFSIPFKMLETSGKISTGSCITTEIPGGLPSEYSQAVKAKQRATERWKRAVKESKMTKDERHAFQLLVEEQFKTWVSETDNQRQLDDLGKRNSDTMQNSQK